MKTASVPSRKSSLPVSVRGSTASVLSQIYRPKVNLCLLERLPHALVREYAALLVARRPPLQLRQILAADDVSSLLETMLPSLPGKAEFIADLASVCEIFSALFEAEFLGLRLHVLTDAPCPLFHTDRIPCRLLLTYHGAGSEWLEEDYVDRSALGKGWSAEGIPARVCLDEQKIQFIPTGHLALFKGEGWEGNEGFGLVHRSPPQSNNEPRLVLTLDLAPVSPA